jgi:glycosyltransferase involved in cell wall biosynthesis
MKIGINGRFLLKPYTGIGQYTENIVKEVAMLDDQNEYIVVVPEKIDSQNFPKNVHLKVLPEKKKGGAGLTKTYWEQIQLPDYFKMEKVDIAFFPYPSNPWANDWYKKNIKTIVTVHDCIPWINKNYRGGFASRMYNSFSKKSVKKADVILTVSKTSKKAIEKCCLVEPNKIKIIQNDAGEVFKQKPSEKFSESILEKYGLKKRHFYLYVGGYDHRKNLRYLIEEFEKVEDKETPFLVLVGGKVHKNKLYSIYDEIESSEIVKTGFIDSEEMAVLYHHCMALVHFSKEEGFNIPLVEAANCGAPLVISNIEIHREVAGDAALYVDIQHKGAGKLAMEKILKPEIREQYSLRSLELAKKYSWKRSAKKFKDVLFS